MKTKILAIMMVMMISVITPFNIKAFADEPELNYFKRKGGEEMKYGKIIDTKRLSTQRNEFVRPEIMNSREKEVVLKKGDRIESVIRTAALEFVSYLTIYDPSKTVKAEDIRRILGGDEIYPVGYDPTKYRVQFVEFEKGNTIRILVYYSTTSEEQDLLKSFAKEWVKANILKNDDEEKKARKIHQFIVQNTEYWAANSSEKEKGEFPRRFSTITLLTSKKGTCGSFTGMFNMLAKEAGLESEDVVGYVPAHSGFGTGKHAWNRVKINGVWREIDITLDDWAYEKYQKVYFDIPEWSMKQRVDSGEILRFPVTKLLAGSSP